MQRHPRMLLPFSSWPVADRELWQSAFRVDGLFGENGAGSQLAPATRQSRLESYGRFLGFLAARYPRLLRRPPEKRLDQRRLAEYVAWRRQSCGDISLAADLGSLRGTFKLICPDIDWSWVQSVANRIANAAPRRARRLNLVTSERLYDLGIHLMDAAVDAFERSGRIRARDAVCYRDGLIISLLAIVPLRRRALAALTIGHQLVKNGNRWELDIPSEDTKTRHPLEYALPQAISARINQFLERFRSRIHGADKHTGVWPSQHNIPMRPDSINVAVTKRTKKAFGFSVNVHRFRHAAASLWSIYDPVNVRGAKDLLGQTTFATTEKHYITTQSRVAGRALAQVIEGLKGRLPSR